MISGLTDAGALPALKTVMKFAAQRQRIISHNIANASTPDFRPADVSVPAFQEALGEAIDQRRRERGGMRGGLDLPRTPELRRDERGELRLEPRTASGNVLFQDRNNRDVERMMQSLAENASTFRVASELLRSQKSTLSAAISESP